MNEDIKSRWLAALRSGDYKQGKDFLHNVENDTYCCLGVLCDIYAKGENVECRKPDGGVEYFFDAHEVLPNEIIEWAGFKEFDVNPSVKTDTGIWESVAELNDNGNSFIEIAGMIERSL